MRKILTKLKILLSSIESQLLVSLLSLLLLKIIKIPIIYYFLIVSFYLFFFFTIKIDEIFNKIIPIDFLYKFFIAGLRFEEMLIANFVRTYFFFLMFFTAILILSTDVEGMIYIQLILFIILMYLRLRKLVFQSQEIIILKDAEKELSYLLESNLEKIFYSKFKFSLLEKKLNFVDTKIYPVLSRSMLGGRVHLLASNVVDTAKKFNATGAGAAICSGAVFVAHKSDEDAKDALNRTSTDFDKSVSSAIEFTENAYRHNAINKEKFDCDINEIQKLNSIAKNEISNHNIPYLRIWGQKYIHDNSKLSTVNNKLREIKLKNMQKLDEYEKNIELIPEVKSVSKSILESIFG